MVEKMKRIEVEENGSCPHFLKDPLGTTENPDDHRKWREIYTIAGYVIRGEIDDPVNGANHYYDDSIVRPDWANQESLVRKIDRIFFYRL